eukprot:jgi/Astpho2/8885/Aster-05515
MNGRNWNVHLMMMPVEVAQGAPGDFSSLMELLSGLGLPGVAAGAHNFAELGDGAHWEQLMTHLMDAHQPATSPTDKAALDALPRRSVRPDDGHGDGPHHPQEQQDGRNGGKQGKQAGVNHGAQCVAARISLTFQSHVMKLMGAAHKSSVYAACACDEPCTVCHEAMEAGTEVLEMPCKHCYHEGCITSWLSEHNTCPICRTALPVDESRQQEQRRQQRERLEQSMGPRGLPEPLAGLLGAGGIPQLCQVADHAPHALF